MINPIESVGRFAVLLVRLDANDDVPRLSNFCRFAKRVSHQDVVFLFGLSTRVWGLRPC